MKEAWDVSNGMLTPTMKIKRNELNRYYAEQLQSWYNKEETVIWENNAVGSLKTIG